MEEEEKRMEPISPISPRRQVHRRNHSHVTSSSADALRNKWNDSVTLQVKLPDLATSHANNIAKRCNPNHDIETVIGSRKFASDDSSVVSVQNGYAIRVRRQNPAINGESFTGEISKLLLKQNTQDEPNILEARASLSIPLMWTVIIPIFTVLGFLYNPIWWLIGTIIPVISYTLDVVFRCSLINMVNAQVEYRRARLLNERTLVNQLLQEIYPTKILRRIRAGEQPILDQYKNTSVLFTDIVGFTQWCSNISPYTLAIKLNHIYSIFDYLSEKYNVYKVETIGDAYMAVAGCPDRTDDHALRILRFAVSLMGAVEELRLLLHKPDLQIRAGIHSGAVVAGVLGSKRHQFHLYGDTVNMAARMESTGVPNRIQLSEATHKALSGSLTCVSRGIIDIKGKGSHPTFMLQLGDWINSYDWDSTGLTLLECSYMATELLIRACALNTLACTVDELSQLIIRIITEYDKRPDALKHAITTMHALHRFLIDTDVYQFMSEIEIIVVLLVTLCGDLTDEQQKVITEHVLFERCNERVVLVSRIMSLRNTINVNNHKSLVKDLDSAILAIMPRVPLGDNDRSYMFHELTTDPANRWLILAAMYRLASIIRQKPVNEERALIIILNGCLDLGRISPHIFRFLGSATA